MNTMLELDITALLIKEVLSRQSHQISVTQHEHNVRAGYHSSLIKEVLSRQSHHISVTQHEHNVRAGYHSSLIKEVSDFFTGGILSFKL